MSFEAMVRGRLAAVCNCAALATLMLLVGVDRAAAVSYQAWVLTPSGFTDSLAFDIASTPSGPKEVGYGIVSNGREDALLWDGHIGYTNLDTVARAYGISPRYQVGIDISGYSGGQYPYSYTAVRWEGTAASKVDIHPIGYINSWAWDNTDSQGVGYVAGAPSGFQNHAYAWNWAGGGSELHPPLGFTESVAYGTNDVYQVGYGMGPQTGGQRHALLWSGTANSWSDLHPASGYSSTEALGIGGSQAVGYGYGATFLGAHALLWRDLPPPIEDLVDLQPPSGLHFHNSQAYGTNGTQQVGFGDYAQSGEAWRPHALLWSGTASSAVDLHQFLPSGAFYWSRAMAIDSRGNIVGYAAYSDGHTHGILWEAIPEPSTLLLLLAGLVCLLLYAWRRWRP